MEGKDEKRKFKRFHLPVIRFVGKNAQGIHGVGNVLDVSREGFRILSAASLDSGTVLDCVITIPGITDIRCQAEVRWSELVEVGQCQGLCFLQIDPPDRGLLVDYVYGTWVENEKTRNRFQES